MELVANRSVVELELRRALGSRRANLRNKVLLLRAAPQWRGESEFPVEVNGNQVPVTVAACPTVLAVLDALAAAQPDGRYLVVLTPCDTRDVGDSVLARALQPEIKPINRWDLVQEAFGANQLDPVLAKSGSAWIAEALLDAQPGDGWRRLSGTVLTRATALNRLAATRLSITDADDAPLDAAALLQWTTDTAAVASFHRLRDEERTGLTAWLVETVGPVAQALFAMPADRIPDAVPVGLALAALYPSDANGPSDAVPQSTGPAPVAPGKPAGQTAAKPPGRSQPNDAVFIARVRAEERYFAGHASAESGLRIFGKAAESMITRWADNGHAAPAAALCERAEAILAELAATAADRQLLASRSGVLEAGMDARLTALAEALIAGLRALGPLPTVSAGPATSAGASVQPVGPDATAGKVLATIEDALAEVGKHGRKKDREAEIRAAEDAVRLARWLATPETPPTTLADAATRMLRSWAWVDSALAGIGRAATARTPRLGQAYATLWERGRKRRADLDADFARRLAAWTEASSATGDLVLVENLLDRIARPVADKRPPVIVVLDGMTGAIATRLAGELTGRGGWVEVGRSRDGREPALATVPSVTVVSRASLLSGTLVTGGQDQERSGFTAFWGRRKTALFHKADLAPEPGRFLATQVSDAITAPDTVVAVVLNAVDDALDKGKTGGPHWTVDEITYLRAVLDEARRAGRPVILTADHGHVLDAGEAMSPRQAENARYRAGVSGLGEITVRGPRVIVGGGEVVAAVDEAIHYTPKRAGYHGGASPAEVVIPVITLLPSESLRPSGWFTYDHDSHAPAWWNAPTRGASAETKPPVEIKLPAETKPAATRRKRAEAPGGTTLFDVTEVATMEPAASSATPAPSSSATPGHGPSAQGASASLGARVTASARMTAQRQFVRRAPDNANVARLIDALAQSGGRLTATEAAVVAGESPVRMSGYLAHVARLLNVDGYAVLQTKDDGRTLELNSELLRQQFLDGLGGLGG